MGISLDCLPTFKSPKYSSYRHLAAEVLINRIQYQEYFPAVFSRLENIPDPQKIMQTFTKSVTRVKTLGYWPTIKHVGMSSTQVYPPQPFQQKDEVKN
jgi:hypothetical protein